MHTHHRTAKAGWLMKQSRHLKQWRRRWVVLSGTQLYSFKDSTEASRADSATECLDLTLCKTIRSADDDVQCPFAFRIDAQDGSFYFKAADAQEKEAWIGCVGKHMVRPSVLKSADEDEIFDV
eukprot:Polyplicarium_translucidae@DN3330_c0_g1_i10.p10